MKKCILFKLCCLCITQGMAASGQGPFFIPIYLGFANGAEFFFLKASTRNDVSKVVVGAAKKAIETIPHFIKAKKDLHRIAYITTQEKRPNGDNFNQFIEHKDILDEPSKLTEKMKKMQIDLNNITFHTEQECQVYFQGDKPGKNITALSLDHFHAELKEAFNSRNGEKNFEKYIQSFLPDSKQTTDNGRENENDEGNKDRLKKILKITGIVGLVAVIPSLFYIALSKKKKNKEEKEK